MFQSCPGSSTSSYLCLPAVLYAIARRLEFRVTSTRPSAAMSCKMNHGGAKVQPQSMPREPLRQRPVPCSTCRWIHLAGHCRRRAGTGHPEFQAPGDGVQHCGQQKIKMTWSSPGRGGMTWNIATDISQDGKSVLFRGCQRSRRSGLLVALRRLDALFPIRLW